MAQLITELVQNIGGGIGLASEAYKAHKAKKPQNKISDVTEDNDAGNNGFGCMAEEEAWELDEAQEELVNHPDTTKDEPTDPVVLADMFITRVPPSQAPLAPFEQLPFPIIISQRRPSRRSRGLVKAYPPILESRGIDAAMFIDFIDTFNKSVQASKWIAALNLASIGTIWLPTITSILVSMAIQVATTAAMEVQSRCKTNRFLEKINKDFFMPRGLFCLILTWNSDSSDTRSVVDFDSIAMNTFRGQSSKSLKFLRSSDGKTYGEFQWPEIAPLVYPALDTLASPSTTEGQVKQSSLKKQRDFVEDYLDRRAQAKFAMNNPDSALANGPKPTFSSRYADPSHPANSGSPIALLTGGIIQMPDRSNMRGDLAGLGNRQGSKRGSMSTGQFERGRGRFNGGLGRGVDSSGRSDRSLLSIVFPGLNRRVFEEAHLREGQGQCDRNWNDHPEPTDIRAGGRGGRGLGMGSGRIGSGQNLGPLGLVQKVMKKDVLYLLIVDMPSDADLAAAHESASKLMSDQR